MRVFLTGIATLLLSLSLTSCRGVLRRKPASSTQPASAARVDPTTLGAAGFDRNDYPGDDAMATLKKQYAYTGYWLTPPPGEQATSWTGKRPLLRNLGYGFLVLANGRLDKEILAAQNSPDKTSPGTLGRHDAVKAAEAARAEGFPIGTTIFLDQEEGGRLLDEQADYIFGWTEAVDGIGYHPGVYVSGQPVPDGPGKTITTVDDIRARLIAGQHHAIAVWIYQDACAPLGPAPGCTAKTPPLDATGIADIVAWQYAQSPRRPAVTQSCAKTYAPDGNCYPPGSQLFVDMDVATSADPSNGR
jgi:hypothetical protein